MEQFISEIKTYLNMMREDIPLIFSGVITLTAAFAILILGWLAAKIIRRAMRRPTFGSHRLDATLRPVLASTVFYVILAMTLYAFLTKLGVPATSLLAVFGAAGLAIGLALKDTLSNIASGVMMLTLRPLQVGEFVDTPNAVGTVVEIGLFATTIKNNEGVFLFIPNSQVWHSSVTNYARHTERKLVVDLGVSYESDIETVKAIMLQTMNDNPRVQQTPTPPECHVLSFGNSAVIMTARCWMPADDWLKNSSDIHIALKTALDKAGIEIPRPQRVVMAKPAK